MTNKIMEKQKKILDELITYMLDNEGAIVEHYVVCQLVKMQRVVDKNNIIPPVIDCMHNYEMIGHQMNGHWECSKCGHQKDL